MLRAIASVVALPTYTYATLPSASGVGAGYRVRASDIGISPGMALVSDGARWIPDGVQVLARSAVAVSGAADTNENTLATITVPASLLGLNGGLRIQSAWTMTNNANAKTIRARYSGAAGTIVATSAATSSAVFVVDAILQNRNSASSQFTRQFGLNQGGGNTLVSTWATSAVDSTAQTTLLLTMQKASAGDTATLESYLVEVLP